MGNCTSRLADEAPQRDSSLGRRSGAKRRKKCKKVKSHSKCIDEDEERVKAAGCFQFKCVRNFFRKRRGSVMEDLPTPGSLDADDGPASTAASNMLQVTSPDADCNAVELVDAAQLSYRKAGTVDSAPTPGVDAMSYGDRLLHDIAIGLDKVDAEDSDEEFAVLEGLCELVEEDPNLTLLASRHVQVEEDTVACTAIATGDDSKDRLRDGIADEKHEAEVQEYDQVWDNVDTKGMVQHNDQHPTRLSTIPEEEEGDEWEDSIDMQTTDVLERQTRREQAQATHPTEFVPLYNVVNRAHANGTPRSSGMTMTLYETTSIRRSSRSTQVQVEEDTVTCTAIATGDDSKDRLRDGIDDEKHDAEVQEYGQVWDNVDTKGIEHSEGKSIDEFTTEHELETSPVEETTMVQHNDQHPTRLDTIPDEEGDEWEDSIDMQTTDVLQRQARREQAQATHPTEFVPLYNVVNRAYANSTPRSSGRTMPLYETSSIRSPRSTQVPLSTWDIPKYYAGRYSYGPPRLDGYETSEATGSPDHSQRSKAVTRTVVMGNVGMLSSQTTPRDLNTGRQCRDTQPAWRENYPQQAGYQNVSNRNTDKAMSYQRNQAAAGEHPRMLTPRQKYQDGVYDRHTTYTTHGHDTLSERWNMSTPHEPSMYDKQRQQYQDAVNERSNMSTPHESNRYDTHRQKYQDAVNQRWKMSTPHQSTMYEKTPGQIYQGAVNERSTMYTPQGPNMYDTQRQQYQDAVNERSSMYTPQRPNMYDTQRQQYQGAVNERSNMYTPQGPNMSDTQRQQYRGAVNGRSNMYTPRGPNMSDTQLYHDAVDHRSRLYTSDDPRYEVGKQDRPCNVGGQGRQQYAEQSQTSMYERRYDSSPEFPGTNGQSEGDYRQTRGNRYQHYHGRHS